MPTTWCGLSGVQSPVDRKPDLAAGNQITVIYAHPSSESDRIAQYANQIASDAASADAWWRGQDPSSNMRYDLFAFPNCSGMARLDLADVALPHERLLYAAGQGGRYSSIDSTSARRRFRSTILQGLPRLLRRPGREP